MAKTPFEEGLLTQKLYIVYNNIHETVDLVATSETEAEEFIDNVEGYTRYYIFEYDPIKK